MDDRAVPPAPGNTIDRGKFPALGDSAISLMVKSNSLRATKSIGAPRARLCSGSTATLAPTMPMTRFGLASFNACATFTSEPNDGVEVWITHNSCSRAAVTTGSSPSRAGGASISLLPGTRAAGCASQVGNQKLRISRFAW
jgi:hypothetical protein